MTINAANVFMGSNATISVTLNSENVTGNIFVVETGAKLHLIEMLGVNEGQQHLESVGLEIHPERTA